MYGQPKFLSSFGRRKGRAFTPRQQALLDEYLPNVAIKPDALPDSQRYDAINLEIGFGAGEHLLAMAKHYPETLFIGCEPYLNGVVHLLGKMQEENIQNIRIYTDDVRHLLEVMPAGYIRQAYILFPDPWPKWRHRLRRLIDHDLLRMLAGVQAEKAPLLIATDHLDYSAWILEYLLSSEWYVWQGNTYEAWRTPPEEWTQTRYQQKTTAEGREPVFLYCNRR